MSTTPLRRRLRVIVGWTAAGLLLLGARFVVDATPSHDDRLAPFEVPTRIGEWGTGRNISARVVDAKFSDSIASGRASADGNFLVVDIEAASVTGRDMQEAERLDRAVFEIDGVTYEASNRVSAASIYHQVLIAGVPIAGVLVFELPTELTDGSGRLSIGHNPDPSLDSVIVVQIDLGQLDRTALTNVPSARLAAS